MRIKKTSQYIEDGASLSNVYGTSDENGYTQEYINELNTYSTNEIRVGTWVDGKPLYRKTYIGSLTDETTNYYYNEFYVAGVNVVSMKGMLYSSSNNISEVIPARESTNVVFFREATPRIRIYAFDKTNLPLNSTYNLTVEYTKASD